MNDLKWLEFLDRIAIEKNLKTIPKTTLKAKFPTFHGMVNDRDLLVKFGLTTNGLKKRLGGLYKVFGLPEELDNKAIELQEHLQQESLNWLGKQEQDSIDPPPIPKPTTPATPQIDWLDRSHQLLTAQKHLTTNGLLGDSTRNFDHIHVPLGLIERKERPKVKEEPSPEQGSQLYQTEYTETKRFEHEAFLAEVVGNRVAGKHIAIIGESGAGKTTILTKIGEYLIQQAQQQPEQPFVVAWVSLAAVGDRPLQSYLKDEWLQKVCEDDFEAAWQEWRALRQQGRVWLLLDGLDEMSGDALGSIYRDLGQAWAQNLRVMMTCRINQWEAAAGGNILTNSFDVYRTLDYSYQTSQGEDQVGKFINNWFGDRQQDVANQIRGELDAPGKERIKDLVKNPLRLTLLCASWERDNQALPETQADLYRGFVNYLYGWKAREFQEEVKLKDELNLALGELAKAGLNRASINDGAVRRFRFTASEIRKLWQDLPDALLPAAKNLGWLNVVGEEAGEDVYAFYHPTFQEYFAACSIDDWDYFLPRAHIDRPVPCQGEDMPTYRVFEKQWYPTIRFWFGRVDLGNDLKEAFISKLTNFREQSGDLSYYYYRAYRIAAISVSEFKSSPQAKSIVAQIVKWAFGYFHSEKNQWQTYLTPIKSLARETILLTHQEYAIEALLDLLDQNELNKSTQSKVASILGQVAIGNDKAISALLDLLCQNELNKSTQSKVASILGQVAIGNDKAISALLSLLCQNELNKFTQSKVASVLSQVDIRNEKAIFTLGTCNKIKSHMELLTPPKRNDLGNMLPTLEQFEVDRSKEISELLALMSLDNFDIRVRFSVASILGQIAVGDEQVIAELVALLKQDDIKNLLHYSIIFALVKVDSDNEQAISELLSMLQQNDLGNRLGSTVASALCQIITKRKMPLIFAELKSSVKDEIYQSKYNKLNYCYKVLFRCAQIFSYPEFHLAWHQTHLPTSPFSP